MNSKESIVLLEIENGVATIILNRPRKLNCLTQESLDLLEETLRRIKDKADLRVVIVRGAEDRSFSTGADLKQFTNLDEAGLLKWIRQGVEIFNTIEQLPQATIAAVNGYAFGGGLELALACDFRVATEASKFSFPELKHGWVPGWGGLTRLPRLVGLSKARQLILLSPVIDGPEALRIGLVDQILETSDFGSAVSEFADQLSKLDPRMLSITKAALTNGNRGGTADLVYDQLATLMANR